MPRLAAHQRRQRRAHEHRRRVREHRRDPGDLRRELIRRAHHVCTQHPQHRERKRRHQPQARPDHSPAAARNVAHDRELHGVREGRDPDLHQHGDGESDRPGHGSQPPHDRGRDQHRQQEEAADGIGHGVRQAARGDQLVQRHGTREIELVLRRSGAHRLAAGGARRQATERDRAGHQREHRQLSAEIDHADDNREGLREKADIEEGGHDADDRCECGRATTPAHPEGVAHRSQPKADEEAPPDERRRSQGDVSRSRRHPSVVTRRNRSSSVEPGAS